MKPYLICPTCGSDDVMKNGTTRRGKQNYKCRDCGRQFVEDPQWKAIDPDRKAMVDVSKLRLRHRLLMERIPLAEIARVMQLSADWLQGYVNRCYEIVPRTVQVQPKDPPSSAAASGSTGIIFRASLGMVSIPILLPFP
jgi:insertion element IS1 protein InsB